MILDTILEALIILECRGSLCTDVEHEGVIFFNGGAVWVDELRVVVCQYWHPKRWIHKDASIDINDPDLITKLKIDIETRIP